MLQTKPHMWWNIPMIAYDTVTEVLGCADGACSFGPDTFSKTWKYNYNGPLASESWSHEQARSREYAEVNPRCAL